MRHRRSYRLGTGRAFAVLPTLNRIIFSVVSLHVLVRNLGSFPEPEYVSAIDASIWARLSSRIQVGSAKIPVRVRSRRARSLYLAN